MPAASHLFTLRLWHGVLGDDRVEWRGQVTHMLSGESHYFREWQKLEAHLLVMAASAGQLASAEPDMLPKSGESRLRGTDRF